MHEEAQMSAIKKEVVIGNCRLLLGDCLAVMPTLGKVDAVVTDPPYEAVMQDKWGTLSKQAPSSHVRFDEIRFQAIDGIRDQAAKAMVDVCQGWLIAFCMAEGVRAWRDAIEAAGARYKRAMVWVKPDAMPQFNGQGPSVGHEMMVSAWCGKGHSKWNGGGRPGTFIYNKNTQGGAVHPTQKPLALMSELVALFSFVGDTVLDPFMGSGTTGVSCANLGRSFVGIEQDFTHFENAVKRITDAHKQADFFVEKPAPVKMEQGSLL
jgi:site-specific DNA-methyltransferase (adenine-specific)